MTLRPHSWPAPSQAIALVASPRLGLRQEIYQDRWAKDYVRNWTKIYIAIWKFWWTVILPLNLWHVKSYSGKKSCYFPHMNIFFTTSHLMMFTMNHEQTNTIGSFNIRWNDFSYWTTYKKLNIKDYWVYNYCHCWIWSNNCKSKGHYYRDGISKIVHEGNFVVKKTIKSWWKAVVNHLNFRD